MDVESRHRLTTDEVEALEDWVRVYEEAGLDNVQVTSGPFEIEGHAGSG